MRLAVGYGVHLPVAVVGVGVELVELQSSVDDGVVDPAILDICNLEDAPDRLLMCVRAHLGKVARDDGVIEILELLDAPVAPDEAVLRQDAVADAEAAVLHVGTGVIRCPAKLDNDMVVAEPAPGWQRVDGGTQRVGVADQR